MTSKTEALHGLVVLPVGPSAVLHRFHAGRAVPLCELDSMRDDSEQEPLPSLWARHWTPRAMARHRVSRSGQRVASLFANKLVTREHREGTFEVVDTRPLPRGTVHDLRFLGERLFLAGRFEVDGAPSAAVEVVPTSSAYAPLPMPAEAAWKHVDVLVPAGDRLVAVDDIVRPRWMYDWTFSPTPTLGTVAELVLATPNVVVKGATLVGHRLCVLQAATHSAGTTWAIGVYDAADLKLRREYLTLLRQGSESDYAGARRRGMLAFLRGNLLPTHAITSDGERLWAAAGGDGLGVVDFSRLHEATPIDERMPAVARYRALKRRRVPNFRYLEPPPGRYVVDVATVPGTSGCFALLAQTHRGLPVEFARCEAP